MILTHTKDFLPAGGQSIKEFLNNFYFHIWSIAKFAHDCQFGYSTKLKEKRKPCYVGRFKNCKVILLFTAIFSSKKDFQPLL